MLPTYLHALVYLASGVRSPLQVLAALVAVLAFAVALCGHRMGRSC